MYLRIHKVKRLTVTVFLWGKSSLNSEPPPDAIVCLPDAFRPLTLDIPGRGLQPCGFRVRLATIARSTFL